MNRLFKYVLLIVFIIFSLFASQVPAHEALHRESCEWLAGGVANVTMFSWDLFVREGALGVTDCTKQSSDQAKFDLSVHFADYIFARVVILSLMLLLAIRAWAD